MRPVLLATLVLAVLASASVAAPLDVRSTPASAFPSTDAADVGWRPNFGQVPDGEGRPARDVLYLAEVPGARVVVTTQGLTHWFVTRRATDERDGGEERENPRERRGPPVPRDVREPVTFDWARLDVHLLGADVRAERARVEQPLPSSGHVNYYLPHCPQGVRDVPAYGRVTFGDVYPGVDWVVRTESDRSVHHDFVVAPGADPAVIRMRYEGASAIELSADGRTLVVRTSLGEVREGALRCWQGAPARDVPARFRVQGDVVTVEVPAYDRNAPLVVDPPLSWYTLYGGDSFDGPQDVVTDPVTGDVYVVGYTGSTTMPVLNPGGGSYFQGATAGSVDGFVWKFDATGVRLWATYFGGSDWDTFIDAAVDATGNLFVAGVTPSANMPLVVRPGAWNQAVIGGGQDGMIVEFSPTGALLWSTYFGGVTGDGFNGIAIDAGGKLYLGGYSASADLPLANPGGGAYFQPVPNGGVSGYDATIQRFAANGALEWSTFYGGGPDWDLANGITARGGAVVLTGETSAPNLPVVNPGGGAYFQGTVGGLQDGFVARFDAAGVLTWGTYFGGSDFDSVDEPVIDANGNLFVDGSTYSTDLTLVNPGGSAYFQPVLGGSADFLLAKFAASGALGWSTYYGGSGLEGMAGYGGKSAALDAQGRFHVTAQSASPDLPVLNPGGGAFFSGTYSGNGDAVLMQFANDGTRLWATYMGRPSMDFGRSVTVAANGCMFAVGEVQDNAGPLAVNPGGGAWFTATNQSPGQDEGYIARFCSPPSACCLDFTCVPVWSAAQCADLGGASFHPNTSCVPSPCTGACAVCGRKFSDLDGDGVQDPGEPGLSGWTIRLLDLANVLVATATTNAQGDYCFTNLACGTYTVSEVQQPGWVTTAPANGSHVVSPQFGGTATGVNFANRPCAGNAPCVGVPPGVAGRWTFDELPGATAAVDVTHAEPASQRAVLAGGATGASGALCLQAPGDHARVPAADQLELDFGTGSFAAAVRLRVDAGSAGPRVVLDQRAPDAGGLGVRGWSLFLMGQQAFLELDTGGAPQVVPGPMVPADTWTQLAVSVDRAHAQGLWYLDGETQAAYGFTPVAGALGGADLVMGQAADGLGGSAPFAGCLDEVVLWDTAVGEEAARKALGPPPVAWCPDYAVLPQVTTLCKNRDSVQVCFQIGNATAVPQTFQWSFAGLPAGPGCTVAGPVQFTPSAGTVTVPPGGNSGAICVLVRRPVGLTAQNATACYALSWLNAATGVCRTRSATLRADTTCWCAPPTAPAFVTVPARVPTGTVIGLPFEHPCDPRSAPWRVVPRWTDPVHADPLALALNGLAPGVPVTGTLPPTSGAGRLDVVANFPRGHDPSARYELVFEMDTDGDGSFEPLSTTIVSSTYDTTGVVDVPTPPAPGPGVRLLVGPNPFVARTSIGFTLPAPDAVELAVHDLSGRRVRRLAGGRLAAGPHRVEWDGRLEDGRRAAAGVYFVRLVASGTRLEAKLVKVP